MYSKYSIHAALKRSFPFPAGRDFRHIVAPPAFLYAGAINPEGGFMRRNPYRICKAIAILLLFSAAVVVCAQEEDDAEDYPRTAVLGLYSQPNGTTLVTFYSQVPVDEMAGLREAIGSALRCDLSAPEKTDFPAAGIKDPAMRKRHEEAQARLAKQELRGTCTGLLDREQLRTSVDLKLRGVLDRLRMEKFEFLTVSFSYPSFPKLRMDGRQPIAATSGLLTFQLPVANDAGRIHFEWGYQKSDIIEPLVTAAIFILVPCALILWVRSRALHLHVTDRAGAWFSYIRTQHLATTAAWLIWIGGGYSIRGLFASILTALWGSHSARAAALSISYFILPPVVVLLVSAIASYRVMVEVRQVQWKMRDFLGLQLAQLGMVMIPILGVYSGIQLMGDFRWVAWGLIIVSFWALPFTVYLRRKLTGRYPEPVISGEFHDRIFLLARRAGVTLKGIFLLPSGKLPVANAFAAGNGIVMVTDYILQKLNRREVEAVAAHEIGHLQYKHPKKLGLAILGIILLPVFLRIVLPTFFHVSLLFFPVYRQQGLWGADDGLHYPSLDFLVAIVCLLLFYALSRRYERIADERSVTLTDDPEALIMAFTKLSILNLTPLQWGRAGSEALTTHPSMLKRIRRIAQIGNVPDERVRQLLENPAEESVPVKPAELFESPRPAAECVYPVREQAQRAQANLLVLIAVSVLVPSGFAYAAAQWNPDRQWPVLLAGLMTTFVAYALTFRSRLVGGRKALRKRFEAHLARLHPTLDLSHAHLVGYSPEAWPRFYYVQSYFDTGLLVPTREGIFYFGDNAKFLLPFPAIRECIFADGIPAWWKVRRSYIRWEKDDAHGAMNFVSLDPCSPFRVDASNRKLHEVLEAWRSNAASLPHPPTECASMGLPMAGAVKSKTLRQAYALGSAIKLGLLGAIPGVLIGNLLLGFSSYSGLWAMAYIPGVVLLLRFVEWLPYWRYRDRPVSPEWRASSKVVENQAAMSPRP